MSLVYLNPQHSSSIPFIELKGDHQHNLPIIMGYVHDHVTSSNTNNTYFSRSSFDNNNNTSNEYPVVDYSRRTQERVIDQKLILSHDKPIVYPFNNHGDNNNRNNNINKIIKIDQKPKKCKQSKERILQKASTTTLKSKRMIIGDHNLNYDHGNNNLPAQVKQSNMYYHKSSNEINKNNNNNFIRTCTDCHTTTTPLWRSGPQGPKSLCNACGIRQRKARRAAAAAAAAMAPMDDVASLPSPISSTTTTTTTTTTKSPKLTLEVEEVKSPKNLAHETIMTHTLPLKKRSKTFNDHTSWNYNNNNNNNININSSNNDNDNMDNNNNNINDYSSRPSYYSTQRVFPKDEEEGAILLMALSCGLACSS